MSFPLYEFCQAWSSAQKLIRPGENVVIFQRRPDKKAENPACAIDIPGDSTQLTGAGGMTVVSSLRLVLEYSRWVSAFTERLVLMEHYNKAHDDIFRVLRRLRMNSPDGFTVYGGAKVIGATFPIEQSSQDRVEVCAFNVEINIEYTIPGD